RGCLQPGGRLRPALTLGGQEGCAGWGCESPPEPGPAATGALEPRPFSQDEHVSCRVLAPAPCHAGRAARSAAWVTTGRLPTRTWPARRHGRLGSAPGSAGGAGLTVGSAVLVPLQPSGPAAQARPLPQAVAGAEEALPRRHILQLSSLRATSGLVLLPGEPVRCAGGRPPDRQHVVDIMRVNVDKVLERDQKLSELDDRADALQAGASQFETSAAKLKRKYWWKNCKMWAILIVTVLIIIIIIIVWSTSS
uniref:Vesicle associated membrane protein 3 n=1 Tax=Crocodylus porosus TaxID=8502 RepID=A0A7M4EZK2_CROPO